MAHSPESLPIEFVHQSIVEDAINGWVETAYQTTLCGSLTPEAITALREMRWLHLAQPELIAGRILGLLKLAGWTPPEGEILIDYTETT